MWDAVNGLAALGAMVIAGYALHHTRRVDRRVTLEPYFRGKWRRLHGDYVSYLNRVAGWLQRVQPALADPNEDLLPFPTEDPPKHTEIDWTYDPKSRLVFDQLSSLAKRVGPEVSRLKSLRHITSSSRKLILGLRSIGASSEGDSPELVAFIEEICLRCLGEKEAAMGELERHPRYQEMVARSEQSVKELVTRLELLVPLVRRQVDHYGTSFTVDRET